MARGLILSPQSRNHHNEISRWRNLIFLFPPRHFYPLNITPTRLFCCKSSLVQDHIDLAKYKEAFSRRMAMAGLKPHHRIGVSGGPHSMALCFLTAAWKTEGPDAVAKSGGFVDGLLAIIVDHGLRAEIKEEAYIVFWRVSEMDVILPVVDV